MGVLDSAATGVRPAPAIDLRSDVLSPPTPGDVRGHDRGDDRLAPPLRGPARWRGSSGSPPRCSARRRRCSCPTRRPRTCSRLHLQAQPGSAVLLDAHRARQRRRVARRCRRVACCRARSRRIAATWTPPRSRRPSPRTTTAGRRGSTCWSSRTPTRSPAASSSRRPRPRSWLTSPTSAARPSTSTAPGCGTPRSRSAFRRRA